MKLAWHHTVAISTENQVMETLKEPPKHRKSRQRGNSNLATPTSLLFEIGTKKPIFTSLKKGVAIKSGTGGAGRSQVPRIALINARGFPYHEARLIDFDGHPSKKWYIIFYAWDIGKEKLIRKRVGKFELNKIKDLHERRKEAHAQIHGLNKALAEGAYLETSKIKEEIRAYDFHGYKLLAALDYVYNFVRDIEQKTKNTLRQYRYTKNTIREFMKFEGIEESFLLRQLTPSFVHRLTEYLRTEKNLANKTHNGVVTIFHSGIEKLRKLDNSLFRERNPVTFQKFDVTSRTHAAYSEEQLKQISAKIGTVDAQLLLFIRFIYFTLGRPKEIRLIKVGHIRIEHKRILMAGENAKTNKEKYVGISQAFETVIHASGILNYPAEYFIFTSKGMPGPVPVGTNYFYKHYKEHLKALGFKKLNDRYTLYSFKHSGAIQLFLKTKDPELVRKQCRHTALSQTNTYLQELGLFTDFKGLDKVKGF